MKKEIGSIFPLNNKVLSIAENTSYSFPKDRIYYSLCREALYDIALSLSHSTKEVLIPAFTCQTVITPFEEAGWKCHYYGIKKNLRIDTTHLIVAIESFNVSLLVVHPYFGMELSEAEIKALQYVSDKGIQIILDITQCIFSNKTYPFVTYTVGSYRKWFSIPDGGFLLKSKNTKYILQPLKENTEFTEREIAAMYLRGQYFCNDEKRTKDISIRLSKEADHIIDSNISPHSMSKVAYSLLLTQDINQNRNCRFSNSKFLFTHIKNSEKVSKVYQYFEEVTTPPLYFIIYVDDRPSLQRLLIQNSIYAPVIWPVEDENVLINEEVRDIYRHLLAIPCDQRYDINDMKRVVEIIKNYQA